MISNELAELMGIQLGDGCISITNKYFECAIAGDLTEEREYYDNIVVPLYNKLIFKPILNKEIFPKEYPKNGTYGMLVFNKKIVNFFLRNGLRYGSKINSNVPKEILDRKSLWPFFLRGIFDTDGSIYFNKNYSVKEENRKHNRPRIIISLTSKMIIDDIVFMLKNMGYYPYLKPPYKGKRDKNLMYSLIIARKNDVYKFIKEIGFNSSKHLTKWLIYKKLGLCPPYTTLKERYKILNKAKDL